MNRLKILSLWLQMNPQTSELENFSAGASPLNFLKVVSNTEPPNMIPHLKAIKILLEDSYD
jgi:hypothetical protein